VWFCVAGATVARLNWRADTTARGLAGSLGVMVNYECDAPCNMHLASVCWRCRNKQTLWAWCHTGAIQATTLHKFASVRRTWAHQHVCSS
jgi:hypothetical protein